MKKIVFILVVFAFFVNSAFTGQSPGVGDKALYFSLLDVSGNEVRLSDYKEVSKSEYRTSASKIIKELQGI
jgi:hypothetical protein